MRFDELHAHIPYAKGGKEKVLTMSPYPNITLALPGRHAEDTVPKGADFVVMVTDKVFKRSNHQFTHSDIFKIVQEKYDVQPLPAGYLMEDYLTVITGGEVPVPKNTTVTLAGGYAENTMNEVVFLHAVQCLAVAEHRRYHKYESLFGGRYLPFRASAGIADGKWTAKEASERTRRGGRRGVEWLEQERGVPDLTKELMKK